MITDHTKEGTGTGSNGTQIQKIRARPALLGELGRFDHRRHSVISTEINDLNEARDILVRLNHCHDGSIRAISFLKGRELDPETGNLVYDSANLNEMALCDIKLEMLLNSYEGAKKDQLIIFEFKKVSCFRFIQDASFDYSDVYEVEVESGRDVTIELHFFATEKKIPTLIISCEKFRSQQM